ncbi:MAG TPA: glucose-6-phosphate isomerase [Anaerolineae bacterium]|nr:glucose-6-phosphate isomerase [Anaerolineae bacterium]
MTVSSDPAGSLTAATRERSAVDAALASLRHQRIIERIWQRDHTVWKPDPAEIDNRLGWLNLARAMRSQIGELAAFAQDIRAAGFQRVVLLGMGGSSLCPEVFRVTFGSRRSYPELIVLDSTVPAWVRRVTDTLQAARTLFIVSSKSGGTIEVMSFFKHFWSKVEKSKRGQAGENFIAITDPGTRLEALAVQHGFRRTFLNPADVGGRYSALSHFGLAPAALMGMDLAALLDSALGMMRACQADAPVNPGAILGAALGGLAQIGRDKTTLITSPSIRAFGLWAEQLIAESTGKEGRGIVPIAQEPFAPPQAYGPDRFFVALRVDGDRNAALDRHVAALKNADQPVLEIALKNRYHLGAEFFRWELATAVAGHLLGIHPFDQPNVQESKDNTQRVLDTYKSTRKLPSPGRSDALADLLRLAQPGDYVALMAYLDESPATAAALADLRAALLQKHCLANTLGYGPRFLHSTGQLHKGGANNGLFVQLVTRSGRDVPIPGELFSFGVLAAAQAAGDLASLHAHQRRLVHIEVGSNPVAGIRRLTRSIGGEITPSAPARARRRASQHSAAGRA